MHRVRLSDVAINIASDLTEFKHTLHAPFPDIPVSVIQGLSSPSDCGALTDRDLSDR